MMNRIAASTVLGTASLHAAGALAHPGQQAHVHAGQGLFAGAGHWLAGLPHWTGTATLIALLAGAAMAAVLLRASRARRTRHASD